MTYKEILIGRLEKLENRYLDYEEFCGAWGLLTEKCDRLIRKIDKMIHEIKL